MHVVYTKVKQMTYGVYTKVKKMNTNINIRTNHVEKQAWENAAQRIGHPVATLVRGFMNAFSQGAIDLPPFVARPTSANAGIDPDDIGIDPANAKTKAA